MRGVIGFRRALAHGIVAVSAIAAWSNAASAETVLRIKMIGDLQQIDPIWTSSYAVRDTAYLVYDTLFSTDANYQIKPQMVDTYSVSEDGRTYSFTLRDGLKWHDGPPVTSTDCIASLERWMAKDSLGSVLKSHLDRFERVDDKTFRLILKKPWNLTLSALGKISSFVPFMMPERLAKTAPDKANTEVIGSGPYMMKRDEWVPGSKMVFVKFKDYKPRAEPPSMMAGGKIAGVDRIERIQIPDDLSGVNAMIAGEIDYIERVPPDLLQLIEKNPNIAVGTRGSLGNGTQIVLNHLQPPFDNVRVRQAVQLAINQQEVLAGHFGDRKELYMVCPTLLYCGGPYGNNINTDRIANNSSAKAKALLKEAGYDGTPIVVIHPTENKWQNDVLTVVVEQLRRAGFTVDDRPTDTATMWTWRQNKGRTNAGGWHIFNAGWGGIDMMNPATNVFMTGACEKAYFGWHCDQEMQQLHAAFLVSDSEDERKEIAKKLQARAADIVPFVNGGQNQHMAAWRKNVSGLIDAPIPVLWNITKK